MSYEGAAYTAEDKAQYWQNRYSGLAFAVRKHVNEAQKILAEQDREERRRRISESIQRLKENLEA